MSCSTPEQIAAAAAGEDPEALAHAAACAACGQVLEEQRSMRALLGSLAPVPLTRARREELTAEVLARADELPRRRRGRRVVYASIGAIAAAAAIVLVLAVRSQTGQRGENRTAEVLSGAAADAESRTADNDRRTPDSWTPDTRTPDSRTPDNRTPQPDVPAPDVRNSDVRNPDKVATSERATRTRPATVVASTSGETPQFVRALQAGRDIVDLVEGAITIDARNAAPVHIVATPAAGEGAAEPDVGVRVVKGKIAVKARRGVIQSVTVFAGSAEVITAGRRQVIEAGTVWDATRDGAPAPGLGAFREGWTALRAGDYAAAIAAFDRATDPAIAEDAAYWAAIAAERLGDRTEAARRFTAFLTSFPQSARAPAARLAREKLQR